MASRQRSASRPVAWLLALCAGALPAGCASVAGSGVDGEVYGGVRIDAGLVTATYHDTADMPAPTFLRPLAVIDIVPSAALDTVLLPVTVPRTIARR